MSEVTFIAHITIKQDLTYFGKEELKEVLQATRKEEGCLQYDLFQDIEVDEYFTFISRWMTRAHFKSHLDSGHIAKMMKMSKRLIDKVETHELKKVA